jgi:hypothetical protein
MTAAQPATAELATAGLVIAELVIAELATAELAIAEPPTAEFATAELTIGELAVAELEVVERAAAELGVDSHYQGRLTSWKYWRLEHDIGWGHLDLQNITNEGEQELFNIPDDVRRWCDDPLVVGSREYVAVIELFVLVY